VISSMVVVGFEVPVTEATTTNEVYLNSSGSPEALSPGDEIHKINNIHIDTPGDEFNENLVLLSVDLTPIQETGVNVSSAFLRNVSNTTLKSQDVYESTDGGKSLHAVINHTSSSSGIYIDQLSIGGLRSDQAEARSKLQYPIEVNNHHTRSRDEIFTSVEEYYLTDQFSIIGGSFTIQSQATGASESITDDFTTTPALTVEDVQATVDSSIVITYEDGSTTIAGFQSFSSDELTGNNEFTVRYVESNGFPGPQSVYLIPVKYFNESRYSTGELLPDEVKDRAISIQRTDVYRGIVNFEDYNSNELVGEYVTVKSSLLDDGIKKQTPYALTLHPVDQNGTVLSSRYLGKSRVLSGYESNVKIWLINDSRTYLPLSQSNRYTVRVSLAEGYSPGETVPIDGLSTLLNSDISRGFVDNGVSDKGLISIEGPMRSEDVTNITASPSDGYYNQTMYNTGVIGIDLTNESQTNAELYQHVTDSRGVLVGVASPSDTTRRHYSIQLVFRLVSILLTHPAITLKIHFS